MAKKRITRERPTLAAMKELTSQVEKLSAEKRALEATITLTTTAANKDSFHQESVERSLLYARGLVSGALMFLRPDSPRTSRLMYDMAVFLGAPDPEYFRRLSRSEAIKALEATTKG